MGLRRNNEIFQELFCVFLRGVGFQANFVVHFSGILRLDYDVPQISDQVQPLAIARRHASRQLGADPRPEMILALVFSFLGAVRRC